MLTAVLTMMMVTNGLVASYSSSDEDSSPDLPAIPAGSNVNAAPPAEEGEGGLPAAAPLDLVMAPSSFPDEGGAAANGRAVQRRPRAAGVLQWEPAR